MKNKKIKIFSSLILIIMLIFANCIEVYAWEPNWVAVEGKNAENTTAVIYNVMGAAINVVTIAGAGIAIVMLIVMGIQYTMNSVEKKAELKKQMHSYVMGAIIIFSASGLLQIIQLFAKNINNV